jgi:hypothetical protein
LWPKRLRDKTFRNLVEKTIAAQSHRACTHKSEVGGYPEMQRFEKAYYDWLNEMYLNEMPAYDKVNPLVDVLPNTRTLW